MVFDPYKIFLIRIILIFCLSCNEAAPDFAEKLQVVMVGTFVQPTDAKGSEDPKSLNFTLNGCGILLSDGEYLDLYQDQDPKQFRIIARPQIIMEADLTAYESKDIGEIRVIFDPTVEGVGKTFKNLSTIMPQPTKTLVQSLKIQAGKTIRLQISVPWKNTITVDSEGGGPLESLEPPTLVLSTTSSTGS